MCARATRVYSSTPAILHVNVRVGHYHEPAYNLIQFSIITQQNYIYEACNVQHVRYSFNYSILYH